MEVEGGDPSAVNKNPKIIKAAQEEIAGLDVLVCGKCRSVYHFLEQFKEHKDKNECGSPNFHGSTEAKPQVWGFLLWKSSIISKVGSEKELGTSWQLYQKWVKMCERVRDSWIAAGQAIQSFSIIANAKMQEVHTSRPIGENQHKIVTTKSAPVKDDDDDDESSTCADKKNTGKPAMKKTVSKPIRTSPVDKHASLKSPQSTPTNKDVRTYSSKNDTSNEATNENLEKEAPTAQEETADTSCEQVAIDTDKLEEVSVIKQEVDKTNYVVDTLKTEPGQDTENNKLEVTETAASVEADASEKEEYVETIEVKKEKLSENEDSQDGDSKQVDSHTPLCQPDIPDKNTPASGAPPTPSKAVNNLVKRSKTAESKEDQSSEDEYVVEKIIAKRYNTKTKHYEYLLKWEGYPEDQSTWEPVENMAACDKLVETFERNLARQKILQQQKLRAQNQILSQKTVLTASPKPSVQTHNQRQNQLNVQKSVQPSKPIVRVVKAPPKSDVSQPGPSGVQMESRPVRSSKKKALEQVKSWCGSMAKRDFDGGKRRLGEDSDSDSDEISEKRVKTEPVEDEWSGADLGLSDDDELDRKSLQRHGMTGHSPSKSGDSKRKPGRPRKETSIMNGIKTKPEGTKLSVEMGLESDSSPERKTANQNTTKSTQPPVLVANSKGIIKVDPRQVPNLTSGVYIVTNKSGVVHLQPSSPDKAKTSTPNKLPLLAPKISQSGQSNVVVTNSLVSVAGIGTQSGIVKKPVSTPSPVRLLPKPGTPIRPGSTPPVSSGLVKVSPRPRLGAQGPRPVLPAPRVLGPRPSLGAQRPSLAAMTQRPGLGLTPRGLRPGFLVRKSPVAPSVGPRPPLRNNTTRPPTPGMQVKSGVRPIQAMLGKIVQNSSVAVSSVAQAIAAKKKQAIDTQELAKELLRETEKQNSERKGVGRGRGKLIDSDSSPGSKHRDSKLVEGDSLHMEFQEEHSSESDDGFNSLPELPMGDLPPLEPDSPPRPFTLCPETGKILGRAEGEPSPVPSPKHEPPADPVPVEPTIRRSGSPEEILPDRRQEDSQPTVQYVQQEGGEVLKVEMSPGGTTGRVIEGGEGTVTFATEGVESKQGGVSVPARELVTITGEDGVVYQIQTDGDSGEGQCVYVTTDQGDGSVLTLDSAVAEAVAQLNDQVNVLGGCSQFFMKEEDGAGGGHLVMMEQPTGDNNTLHAQLVAQVVEEGDPAPGSGGTRKVVVMLPDGSMMMTDVDEEQLAALNQT